MMPRAAHPAGDCLHHPGAAKEYAELLERPFLEFLGQVGCSFEKGKTTLCWAEKPALSLPQGQNLDLTSKVKDILFLFRNALSHGNIWTEPNVDDYIETIIFLGVTKPPNKAGYRRLEKVPVDFIRVRFKDLTAFIKVWFAFLKTLDQHVSEST